MRGALVVIGQQRAAVAIGTERLGGKEAGCRCGRQRADRAVAKLGAIALRCIRDQEQGVPPTQLVQRAVVRRLAEKVDGDYGPRQQFALACDLAHATVQVGRVDVESTRVDLDEDGRGTKQKNDLGRRSEGEGWHEDGIAYADPLGHQRHDQGIGAARDTDRMLGAPPCGKRRFQFGNFGPQDELTVI